jgi:chaperonin GroES
MAKKVANYELFDDRVLVRPAAAETKTAGGIIIPDTAKEKPQKGTVVAVGPGKYAEQTGNIIPVKLKVGDVVLYGKYGGTEITLEGEDLLIMRSSDILMKVG